jgi:hypothetical protein
VEPTDLLLPEGTRLVHIGPPKTGTTTLQGAFHGGRDAIAGQGVHYAGPTRQPMGAVLAVMGYPSPNTGEVPSIKKWKALVGEIKQAGGKRVVLSSERLSHSRPEAIRTIVEDLGPGKVHIAVTLRPLAKVIPSQWQQSVQTGLQASFDDYLDEILNDPDGKRSHAFWYKHRHDRLIARWAEIVGPHNVTVIALDDRDHGMVLRVFEQMLGLSEGTLIADGDRTNRSMTLPEVEVVRAFNEQFFAENLSRPLHTKVMRFGATAHIKAREPAPDEPRIETPQWALDRASQISTEMVDAILASGVRLVGDPERLRPTLTSGLVDGRQPTFRIAPEIAGRAAMGVLLASGLARSTKDDDRYVPRPSVEPIALARISTIQMMAVLWRRIRAAVVVRTRRLFRRSG